MAFVWVNLKTVLFSLEKISATVTESALWMKEGNAVKI